MSEAVNGIEKPPTLTPQSIAFTFRNTAGEVLSLSQVRSFMDCQIRWWFKYGLKIPDPQTGNLALGKAVHTALGQNFEQKVETHEDLPVLGVMALFRDAWADQCEQTQFRDDEDPQELARMGEASSKNTWTIWRRPSSQPQSRFVWRVKSPAFKSRAGSI